MKTGRTVSTVILIFAGTLLWAQSLRGPIAGTISEEENNSRAVFGMEEIVVIDIEGDPRLLDGIEIELETPAAVSSASGALSIVVLAPARITRQAAISDVVGEELLRQPLQRGGRTFYQIALREGAELEGSAAVLQAERPVPASQFPIAVSVVSRMKGTAPEIYQSEFSLSVDPIVRDAGILQLQFRQADGRRLEPSLQNPGFRLEIDNRPVQLQDEYFLSPGLRRVRLISDRYENQSFTIGVERGRSTQLEIPLVTAVATVRYTAPESAQVYLNGEALRAPNGDFTVAPGEHTIVVVIDDYTVTRRFTVEEQREYSLSLMMDIVVEEVN
jgi:hypothetical protein